MSLYGLEEKQKSSDKISLLDIINEWTPGSKSCLYHVTSESG